MGLPRIHTLTETDVKLLLSLIRKQTLEELVKTTGVPYSYAQRRVRFLKSKRYIDSVDKSGQAFVYQTCRLPETEQLFNLADTVNGSNNGVYRIPYFYNTNPTFGEAVKYVLTRNKEYNIPELRLITVIQHALSVIKVRSWRKSTGEQFSQRPDEGLMREILGKYIAKTEKELALAKELYNTKFLWSGHENVWQIISEGEPNKGVIEAYQKAGNEYG